MLAAAGLRKEWSMKPKQGKEGRQGKGAGGASALLTEFGGTRCKRAPSNEACK